MEHQNSQRRLSEISHLFLSDVRARQTGNAPRPSRKPPGSFKGDVSIDLTPEEFAQVFSANDNANDDSSCKAEPRFKPVRAVVAHHLGELMADRIRDFSGMLCANGKRVGVIYADASDIRVCCVEHNPRARISDEDPPAEPLDVQRLEETLIELNQDIDNWVIVLPDARCAESRDLLGRIPHWTLISGVDHDTIVSSYRTIKGLCEVTRPVLSIAIFGAVDGHELDKTHRKLAGVCEQFLQMNAELVGAIEPGDELAEYVVFNATAGNGASAPASHWKILQEMIRSAMPHIATHPPVMPPVAESPKLTIQPQTPASVEASPAISHPRSTGPVLADDGYADIIDLPHADASPAAIISAVIRGGNELVESPVKPPRHAGAVVTVSREHRLVLIAVATQGLSELRTIAQAYRWMNDNRSLIAMAIPQFSIDTHTPGRLELLIDHADMSADILQPLLAGGNVAVRAYRKLRWNGKTGLLLEAA